VLTGIGRYAWELASRLPQHPDVDTVQYYRQGNWVKEPGALLQIPLPGHPRARARIRVRTPRWFRDRLVKWDCRGRVFHGPNYFIPACAEVGVATIHDLSVFKFPETHPVDRIKQFEQLFMDSISRSSQLITDTETTRREVVDFLGWPAEKVTAVPLGVSRDFAPQSEIALAPRLSKYGLTPGGYSLCVSTLEPRKRIGNLLQAYQDLPAQLRERFPLVLVGSPGWLSEALHKEIERLSNQGWLRYLGFVPEADLPALYSGARAFIYPSIYEGFGLPVLEAMASGVPVITSNRSTLPEVTKGAALTIDPDDIDALRQCIETGLSDETWRSSAKSLGLAVASEYSWDRCIEQTVRVYKSVGQ
jgi:alpha-1,3-rhamnosyl/mannosyltransferase